MYVGNVGDLHTDRQYMLVSMCLLYSVIGVDKLFLYLYKMYVFYLNELFQFPQLCLCV